jgi:hypothetical protein
MAGSSDIRAGRAFVEVYADKTKLTRGLKSVSADLKAFGAGVSALGKKFMLLGAGIAAPLLAATKSFMTAGSELAHMSERTGISATALSELGYAATLSGSSLEAVETGVKRMQNAISAATDGPLKRLQGMAPEDQFMAIADGMSAIQDPTTRAAKALEIFGRGGTVLIPMMKDVKALRAEAVRLGLSMSPEKVAAAEALDKAWERLTVSFKYASKAIGFALAPMLTGLAERIATGVAAVKQWIGDHKTMIVTAFAVGSAAVAAGAGLFVLGKAVTLAGVAIGSALTITKAAVATFGFLQSAVLLLANPFVLIGAACLALGGYLLYATGAAGRAATWISSTFATLSSEVTSTFDVIAQSMAAGDFVSAAKVGWALVKLEWQKGVAFITTAWEGFKGYYDEACTGLALGMINASASIQTIWADLINWMQKTWLSFANSGFTESLTRMMAPLIALATGGTIEEANQAITDTFAGQRAAQGGQVAKIDAGTAAKKAQIEADRQAQADILGGDLAKRGAGRDAAIKAAQDSVDAAKAEWQAAKGEAVAAAAAGVGTKFDFQDKLGGLDLEAAKGPKSSSRGTFSASAASGLGVGGVQERIAKAVEAGKNIAAKQLNELKQINLEAAA